MKTLIYGDDHALAQPVAGALTAMGHDIAVGAVSRPINSADCDVILIFRCFHATHARHLIKSLPPKPLVYAGTTDVYRASAVFNRRSEHAPSLAMLNEESPADEGETAQIEEQFRAAGATILRIPPLYGAAGDLVSQLLSPMDAKRPAILFNPDYANWKCSLAYIENAAHALALCLTHESARGETFNLAEARTPTIAERAHQIARFAKYRGPILALPRDRVPQHLENSAVDFRQDIIVSSDKIRRTLGYDEVVSPEESLKRAIEIHRASPPPFDPPEENLAAEDALLKSLGLVR